ncbi:hypothetical protein M8C21_010170, partial [Ambrosia artemisiifolia]
MGEDGECLLESHGRARVERSKEVAIFKPEAETERVLDLESIPRIRRRQQLQL